MPGDASTLARPIEVCDQARKRVNELCNDRRNVTAATWLWAFTARLR